MICPYLILKKKENRIPTLFKITHSIKTLYKNAFSLSVPPIVDPSKLLKLLDTVIVHLSFCWLCLFYCFRFLLLTFSGTKVPWILKAGRTGFFFSSVGYVALLRQYFLNVTQTQEKSPDFANSHGVNTPHDGCWRSLIMSTQQIRRMTA